MTITNAPAQDDLSTPAAPRTSLVVPGEVLVRFQPTTTRAKQQSFLQPWAASVKFFRHASRSALLQQQAPSALDQLAVVKLRDNLDLSTALAALRKRPEVLYAEPNYRLQITQAAGSASVLPNDFDFAQLWGMHNVGQGDGTAGDDINASEAWSLSTGDKRVVVAVIDTGIDYFHPDLADNVWINPKETEANGQDDDGNGYIDDVHGYDFVSGDGDPLDDQGHGTHVSGTIGAVGNNGIGVAGVCWQVSIMALKAFDETGNGQIDTAIEAIRYAIDNGARIINASWGSTDKSHALEDAIAEAYGAGVLIVAAAGNENSDNPFYPGAYPHVVAVAATDQNDRRSRFSDFGSYVAVAAPGENIYSTIPDNNYQFYSGTSMATPHVSGVAALVLAKHPEFSNDQVANVLRNSVVPLSTDKYVGTGRINAAAALRVEMPLPQVKLSLPATIFGDIDIPGSATGDSFVNYSLEYGQGSNPTNWTSFFTSDTPVPAGTLFPKFSTPQLAEGAYTFRLTARNAAGEKAVERAVVQISNVHIRYPMDEDILRAGDNVQILGTVFGGSRTFRLEHGIGPDPAAWSDNGLSLASAGQGQVVDGLLATWDTSKVAPNQFYTLRLTATAQDGSVTEYRTRLVYLDSHLKPGWPQYLPIVGDYPAEDWRHFVVADLDQDGHDEIILVDHGNNDGAPARLLVYRFDGSLLWSKDLASGYPYSDIPVVGDVDGDGFPEIFVDVGSDGQLFAFHHDGTPLEGNWPVHLEATSLGKVLADLDGDGKKELIGYSQDTVTHDGTDFRQLVVYDLKGNLLRKWEVPSCDVDASVPKILPAVGNLDDDPDLEMVVVSGCQSVAAFKLGKASGPLWTAGGSGTFVASPVIGDIDHNGTNEVVIAALDPHNNQHGGVYAFTSRGHPLPGWPVLLEESFSTTPALADVDRDGQLEICLPGWKSGLIHLLRPDGFEAEGWPVGPIQNSSVKSSVVIGDIDGDGHPDIVLPSPGYMSLLLSTGDFAQAGGLKAWRFDGQPIPLNGDAGLTAFPMESSVGTWHHAPPVALADIDHDGKLDIIAASVQDRTYLPLPAKSARKNRSSLYVWQLDVPFAPERMPWPTFQHDPEHTGFFPSPQHRDEPPVVNDIPNQIIAPGGNFFPIELDQYVDDPDNAPRQITWSVLGNQALQVVITTNRVAFVQGPGAGWVGAETIQFVATDPAGLSARVSTTFEIRPGYIGPTAGLDQVTTPEDTPIEIDVLVNDRDPSNLPLQLASFSKPAFGKVTRTPQGTLLYTPKQDANGQDTFSYVVTNGKGGITMGQVQVTVTPVNDPPVANPDHVIIDEDTPVTIDVLANDTDPDNDPITLVDFTTPENGALTRNPDGTLLYIPSTNYFGSDNFLYTITDPHGATNQGRVDIIIKPVNDPPVAADQSFTLNRNSSVDITFSATDPDSNEFTFTVVDTPKHGSLWNYPKVASYYPTNGFFGEDSFTYRANDGDLDGPIATVHLHVLDSNNPPDVDDQSVVTKVNQATTIHLSATDLDNDPLTFQLLSQPSHGTLTGSGTNYVYQPAPTYQGADAFTFNVSDGKDTSQVATVKIKVTDQNTPPVAEDFAISTFVNSPTNVVLQATDLESDPLAFHVVTRPTNGKLTGKGSVLVYSPKANYIGPDRFSFKASDGEFDSNVGTVTIDVRARNHPPVATNEQVFVQMNVPKVISLAVQDVDQDLLRCPILKGPQHGVLSGQGTNLVYSPKTAYVGDDSFTFKAWDGHAYSHEGQVSITISAALPQLQLAFKTIEPLADGQVRIVFTTPSDQQAELQVSTDLVHWTALPTSLADGGVTSVIDPAAAGSPARFYRARLIPGAH